MRGHVTWRQEGLWEVQEFWPLQGIWRVSIRVAVCRETLPDRVWRYIVWLNLWKRSVIYHTFGGGALCQFWKAWLWLTCSVLYYQGCGDRKGADSWNVVSSGRDQQHQSADWLGSCCLLLSVSYPTSSLSFHSPECVIQMPYISLTWTFWHEIQSQEDWWLHPPNEYFTEQFFCVIGCLLILGNAMMLNNVQVNVFCFSSWSPYSTTVFGIWNNVLESFIWVLNNFFFFFFFYPPT